MRKVCDSCSEPYRLNDAEQRLFTSLKPDFDGDPKFRAGIGCAHCFNTGYRGRIGVFELLELNPAMGDALRESNVRAFNDAAHKHPNYRPLSAGALEFAIEGVTTLDEVLRVSAQVEDESLAQIANVDE